MGGSRRAERCDESRNQSYAIHSWPEKGPSAQGDMTVESSYGYERREECDEGLRGSLGGFFSFRS